MPIRPVFVFSLPRSGSTLVQRVLASHPDVSTVSEPWLLLPFVYARREQGARAEYWHQTAAQAIEDFCRELPGGADDYRTALHDFALELYAKAARVGSTYFIDKSPHYHFIAAEVMRIFPEGKFVFLWRNPLSALASYVETFRDGRWQPYYMEADLTDGVVNLVDAWRGGVERAHAVRFEDLVAEDERPWRELFEYLELDFDPGVLSRFSEVALEGRYGDPTGARDYSRISGEPATKWTGTLAGPVRTAWCRRYLRRLGEDRLGAMGYDLSGLLRELDGLPAGRSSPGSDLVYLAVSLVRQAWRNAAVRTPETPLPIGPAFRPPPPVSTRLRNRAGRLAGRLRQV